MANSRLARLIMEVAPPQYVTVMRHRTSKMLDTISEDERELSPNDSLNSSMKGTSASASTALSAASASASTSASAAISSANASTKYFLREVHKSLSILNH